MEKDHDCVMGTRTPNRILEMNFLVVSLLRKDLADVAYLEDIYI